MYAQRSLKGDYMCEYCKNAKTGNDLKSIVEVEYDCGILGRINISTEILRANDNPSLAISITTDGTSCEKYVPINFCPMCGEKLN